MANRTIRMLALCGTMLGGVGVHAQEQQVRKVIESPAANSTTAQAYRAKEILGSKVHIEGNTAIGVVDDIVFSQEGFIEYLIVLNDKQFVTVPWDAAKFNIEKRMAVVNITPERFRQIPTYTVGQFPLFWAPNYRMQTYTYYGLTPGQERRAIRNGAIGQ